MKRTIKIFKYSLLLAGFSLSLLSCEKDSEDPITELKATYTQLMDIDNDGNLELVVGFEKPQISRLTKKEVVLQGSFRNYPTAFETDEFAVDR